MEGGWTEARIALLKQLWADGMSASECTAKINHDTKSQFSRNATLGKIDRLGLSARRKARPRRERPPTPEKPAAGQHHLNRDFRAATPPPSKATVAPPARPLTPREAITPKTFRVREIHGFTAERCTYDEACTATPVRGRFFCEAHCAIVYVRPTAPKNPQPHYRSQPHRRN